MKRIVILTDQIFKVGGIVSLIHLKANYWVTHRNYEVHIITTEQNKKPSFYSLNNKIHIHDLSIDYNRNISYFSKKNLFNVVQNWFLLKKKINKIKPEFIIIANHIPVSFFFPFLNYSAIYIKEFHFSKYNLSKRKKTIFRRFEKYLESKYDYLVVLNQEERSFYENENIVVIPNGIKHVSKENPVFNDREKIAMAAGRISEIKRFDKLIDIWSKYLKNNTEWKLEIYGEGEIEYIEYLQKKIKTFGLEKFIKIKKSTNNIQAIMRTRSLYLMTSSAECFPMVLLEAHSCGLPIISYDCPTGPRNIIKNNENGILVEYDNERLFVKKLLELTSNKSLRIKLAKKGHIDSLNYSIDKIMSIWDNEILKK